MTFNKILSSTITATVLAFSAIASAQAAELVKANPVNTAEITIAAQTNIAHSMTLLPLEVKVSQTSISSILTAKVKKSDRNNQSVTKAAIVAE